MSNRQYITKAIVCGSVHNMTSDKSYLLFTQDLGMLWATARSVRMEKSKQRYALQDFSIIRVSLVQGKSVWRIGSVEAVNNPFFNASTREVRGGISFVIKTVRKYIQGSGASKQIFTDTCDVIDLFLEEPDISKVQLYQQIFLLRTLYELGYIKKTATLKPLLDSSTIYSAIDLYDNSLMQEISQSITYAQGVSHL